MPLVPLDWPYLPAMVLASTRRVSAEDVNACRCMLRWLSAVEAEEGGSGGQCAGLLDALPLALRFARLSSLFLLGLCFFLSYAFDYWILIRS